MSDLISRSEFLEEIEKYKFGAISNDAEREYVKDTILNFIEFQPTSYDIDKVVEELETKKTKALELFDGNSRYKGYCKAIEIVKHGGVSDDVCKWKLDGVYIFSPHSRMFSCVIDDKHRYTYCPVCGKKIKVVE